MNVKLLITFLLLLTPSLFAQNNINNNIESKIENIAEGSENEDIDYSVLIERLAYYHQHPINLNKTTKEELEEIFLLDDFLINRLLEHIEKNGKLLAIYELQGIEGFTPEVIQKILPYIKVDQSFESRDFLQKKYLAMPNNSL